MPDLETNKPRGRPKTEPRQRGRLQPLRVHGKFVDSPHGLKVVLLHHFCRRKIKEVIKIECAFIPQDNILNPKKIFKLIIKRATNDVNTLGCTNV